MGSPNTLIRQGWRRTSLKEGDQVTVEGYAAKDGSNIANARSVTLPDGTKVFVPRPGISMDSSLGTFEIENVL
jgi:hypothetical protein